MPMIDVRDTRLYYEITGDSPNAILFIHGMCGGAWNWTDQMERLSGEFTCVAYDRRGHGMSQAGNAGQSNVTHADDAAALIEALGLDRPIVVGMSSGGNIALDLLHRNPQLARGAAVSEPPLFVLDPEGGQRLMSEFGPVLERAMEHGDLRSAVDGVFEIVCSRYWALIDETSRNRLRDNAPLLFATLQAEGPQVTPEDLAALSYPMLVISGADSPDVQRSIAHALARLLPDARAVEFDDCAHVTHAEQPQAFATALKAFAREIMPAHLPAGR